MPRKPTRDELRVWDYVTRGDKRLPDATIDWGQVQPQEKPKETPTATDDQLDSLLHKTEFTRAGAAHAQPPQAKGNGIDGNSARRLRQGKFPIEATLDLHGMYREEAHAQLAAFLRRAYDTHKRCVLVITGKGRFHSDKGGEHTGVLRRELPRWLTMPPIAPWVLRHTHAQPEHGGEGAVYILLRRKR